MPNSFNISEDYPEALKLPTGTDFYEPALDGLRAIAIIGVLLYHLFPEYVPGGFIGVDIFFVLSGYLITGILLRNIGQDHYTIGRFYLGRVRRLLPALFTVLLFVWVCGYQFLFAEEFQRLGKQILYSIIFANNFLYNNEINYFESYAKLTPLLHLWSLAVECQFYLFFPFLILLIRNLRYLLIAVIGLIALSFAYNVHFLNDNMISFYLPYARIWEFLIGSALVLIEKNRMQSKAAFKDQEKKETLFNILDSILLLTGISLIGYSFVQIMNTDAFPGFVALLPCLAAALIIKANSKIYISRILLQNRPIVFLGKISYPVYLWHWVIISFTKIIYDKELNTKILFGIIFVSVLLSVLTYFFVEKPFRYGILKNNAPTYLFGFAIFLTILGSITIFSDGFNDRSINLLAFNNRFDEPYKQSCKFISGKDFVDDRCHVYKMDRTDDQLIVIGDSIANSYAPMLEEYIAQTKQTLNLVQYGMGQCPLMIDYGPPYCREFTKKILGTLADNDHPQKIIMSVAWPDYLFGKSWGRRWSFFKENGDEFLLKFAKTVEFLQDKNFQLIVMLMPPEGASPKSCVNRLTKQFRECGLLNNVARSNEHNYRDLLIPLLANKNIVYFDPTKYFCSEEYCVVRLGQSILYNDPRHLSVEGGQYLARKSIEDLQSILN